MLNFLIFLHLQAFKMSCSAKVSMKFFITSGSNLSVSRLRIFMVFSERKEFVPSGATSCL